MIIVAILIPLLVAVNGQVQVRQSCSSCAQQQVGCSTCTGVTFVPLPPTSVELTCEAGFVLQNGYCVRKMDISCPAGSHLEGGRCVIVHKEAPICPLGSEMRDGRCLRIYEQVCSAGYSMVNGQCVRLEEIPIVCPPGSLLQNNECVKIECPKNYRLENGYCVAVREETTPPCNSSCPVTPRPVPCPEGYVFRNDVCVRDEIHCPEGTYRRGDRCERIACPPPSTWNGQFCVYQSPPQPIPAPSGSNTTNIVNNTNIVHNFNNVTHDTSVNVNNVNNVYIYKGGEVVQVNNRTDIRDPESCCDVISPRICKQRNLRWRCFNRKYHRCGSFCLQPTIQLIPARPIYRPPILVMPPIPPIQPNCGISGCVGQLNCSGCETGGHCSPGCYQYSCEGGCAYEDHSSFCEQYGGQGCESFDA